MSNWLNIFKHLLPNAKAWRITIEKTLKDFFDGLTELPAVIKEFFDDIFNDIDPQKTRELNAWEKQFALKNTGLNEQERRDRLDATWKALGGQDPRYLQDTLQNAGFDVYIHEWWVPIPGRPNGGSIDGDVTPVARNPFNYLNDGTIGLPYLIYDGGADSQDGDALAMDGATSAQAGYPLVNKIIIALLLGDGSIEMQDGGALAQDGSIANTYGRKQYLIPNDPAKFPYFLYIGGQSFPDQAFINFSRKEEFEDLCLKICPLEQWLGILVTYT